MLMQKVSGNNMLQIEIAVSDDYGTVRDELNDLAAELEEKYECEVIDIDIKPYTDEYMGVKKTMFLGVIKYESSN